MSGRKVSLILTYGVHEDASPVLSRHIVFPAFAQFQMTRGQPELHLWRRCRTAYLRRWAAGYETAGQESSSTGTTDHGRRPRAAWRRNA